MVFVVDSLPELGWLHATAEQELGGGIVACVLELGFQGYVGFLQLLSQFLGPQMECFASLFGCDFALRESLLGLFQ